MTLKKKRIILVGTLLVITAVVAFISAHIDTVKRESDPIIAASKLDGDYAVGLCAMPKNATEKDEIFVEIVGAPGSITQIRRLKFTGVEFCAVYKPACCDAQRLKMYIDPKWGISEMHIHFIPFPVNQLLPRTSRLDLPKDKSGEFIFTAVPAQNIPIIVYSPVTRKDPLIVPR